MELEFDGFRYQVTGGAYDAILCTRCGERWVWPASTPLNEAAEQELREHPQFCGRWCPMDVGNGHGKVAV